MLQARVPRTPLAFLFLAHHNNRQRTPLAVCLSVLQVFQTTVASRKRTRHCLLCAVWLPPPHLNPHLSHTEPVILQKCLPANDGGLERNTRAIHHTERDARSCCFYGCCGLWASHPWASNRSIHGLCFCACRSFSASIFSSTGFKWHSSTNSSVGARGEFP